MRESAHSYSGRSLLIVAILLSVMAIFVVRLFWLQIIQHGHYVKVASSEQVKRLVIPAKRGEIYTNDKDGQHKIVLNQTVYTVFADPQTVSRPDRVIAAVKEIAGSTMRPDLKKQLADKKSRYKVMATDLTNRQAELLKKKDLSGIGFQADTKRVYPEKQLAAQTLGFVDGDGVGRYGLEGGLNDRLSGEDGLLQSVVDVRDVPLSIGDKNIKKPAKDGDNIVLTIDRNIQFEAEKALARGLRRNGGDKASVIVMDPHNGHIKAMASLPTYNPGKYYKVKNAEAFNNPVISAPYEPGSDIKTLTMATSIDRGIAGPKSTYINTDKIKVANRTIGNASKGQTGKITFQHALNWSLNTGFVTLAQRLGSTQLGVGHATVDHQARTVMYDYFHDRFGLGRLTGIPLAGEAQGVVVPPDDPNGSAVRYSNMSFGQGFDATMLQVASGFSAVVNGGKYYTPQIIAGTIDSNSEEFVGKKSKSPRQVLKPSTSKVATEMIQKARQAFYAGHDKKGYYIGGKTGTSQTIENGKYVNNQTIATYLGFGGASRDDPKYVIMVRTSGKGMNMAGDADAMPIFTDISNWMLDYLNVAPRGH